MKVSTIYGTTQQLEMGRVKFFFVCVLETSLSVLTYGLNNSYVLRLCSDLQFNVSTGYGTTQLLANGTS